MIDVRQQVLSPAIRCCMNRVEAPELREVSRYGAKDISQEKKKIRFADSLPSIPVTYPLERAIPTMAS